LPVVRCACCDGIIDQDTLEAAYAEGSAWLEGMYPDEEVLWQHRARMYGDGLKHDALCVCGDQPEPDVMKKLDAIVSAAGLHSANRHRMKRLGITIHSAMHEVPFGILAHLAEGDVRLWTRDGKRVPHRASATIVTAHPWGDERSEIYAPTVQADHAVYAVEAGLTQRATQSDV